MKVQDILSIDDVRGLTTKELRAITQTLNDAANKRIKRLLSDPIGRLSPFAQRVLESQRYKQGRFFSMPEIKPGTNERQALMKEFKRAREYMTRHSGISSLKGWKKTYKRIKERIEEEWTSDSTWDTSIISDPAFWRAYRILAENWGDSFPNGYDSFKVQSLLAKTVVDGNSIDDTMAIINDILRGSYEKDEFTKKEYNPDEFFEIPTQD